MKDPERLLRHGSQFERALLQAGADDRPSDDTIRNAATLLGLAPGVVALGGAIGATAKAGKLAISSIVLWGSAALLAGTGIVVATSDRSGAHEAREHASFVGPSVVRAAQASIPNLAPPRSDEAPPALGGSSSVARASGLAKGGSEEGTAAVSPRVSTAPPAPLTGGLREQTALIDRARSRLAARDPAGTIALLDEYDTRFRRRLLSEEATLLRIEALAQSGNTGAAAALAARFLAMYPDSLHQKRIAAILGTSAH